MFDTYLYQPLLNSLIFLEGYLGGLGLAIIVLTLIIRFILAPLTIPSLKTAVKMRELQPELNKLKEKYKNDKTGLQQAQLDFFKKHQLNPMAGCLPQIFQIIIFIALYKVFIDYFQNSSAVASTAFLWFDLAKPDSMYILPVVAGVSQFILGIMIAPGADTAAEKTLAANTPDKSDDKQAEDFSSMAANIQQQMIYIMPFMTALIALTFPSGLALYWIVSTVFSIGQQYLVSGWGGVSFYAQKITRYVNQQ